MKHEVSYFAPNGKVVFKEFLNLEDAIDYFRECADKKYENVRLLGVVVLFE